jgi:hypothetical protein
VTVTVAAFRIPAAAHPPPTGPVGSDTVDVDLK